MFTKDSQVMIMLFPFFVVMNDYQYYAPHSAIYSFVRKRSSVVLRFGSVSMNTR